MEGQLVWHGPQRHSLRLHRTVMCSRGQVALANRQLSRFFSRAAPVPFGCLEYREEKTTIVGLDRSGRSVLIAQTGPSAGRAFVVEASGLRIGRDASNDVALHDDWVSRNHCQILRVGSQWVIRDLDSSNGTQINGREIRKNTAYLQLGDVVTVGRSKFRFTSSHDADDRHTTVVAPQPAIATAGVLPTTLHRASLQDPQSQFLQDLVGSVGKAGSLTVKVKDLVNAAGTHRAQNRLRIEAIRHVAELMESVGIMSTPKLLAYRKSPGINAEVQLSIGSVSRVQAPVSPPQAKAAVALQRREVETEIRPADIDEETWPTVVSTGKQLRHVLGEVGVVVEELRAADAQVGPSIIRFRVRVSASTKIAKLQARAADIGRALASDQCPIIDNVPGENYVSIDIARRNPKQLLIQMLGAQLPRAHAASIPFLVGVAPNGDDLILDLAELPHLLVAGSTGSGKTVFLQSLLLSVLFTLRGSELKLTIIDPKETDLSMFNGLPQLQGRPVITNAQEAIEYLREVLSKNVAERTKALTSAGHRNLAEYLRDETLPRIRPMVIVVDEFADLVMQLDKKDRKAFETDVCRIAQRARSVGIHLILATQRPSVEVVTGLIKTNMPCRIAFRVPQVVDSRTILDRGGAENLLGKGDMLLLLNDEVRRLQGYNVTTEALRKAVSLIRARG